MGQLHQALISLGSNYEADKYIPYALARLRATLSIERETELMLTEPVGFPYPSGFFTNVIIKAKTELSREKLHQLLHDLEAYAGRNRSTPALVPLDADLIIWENEVLKPQDLQRPYFPRSFWAREEQER